MDDPAKVVIASIEKELKEPQYEKLEIANYVKNM